MQENFEQTYLEKEIDKIIVKLLFPITDELKAKAKEIKQKKLEMNRDIFDIKQLKQSLVEKRKKIDKQRIIYENHLNGDFSNMKTCEECLINYINLIDKKQSDFIKEKEDYYELKLRNKQLEFNNLLIDLIKEKTNPPKKKRIQRKLSFEPPKRFNRSTHSLAKNLNKSFTKEDNNSKILSSEKDNNKNKKKNTSKEKKKEY